MESFEEIYDCYQSDILGCDDAASLLGCSVRQFHRLRQRYEEEGLEGLRDKRIGKVSPHRAGDAEVALVTQLYKERYGGFSVKHFHEFLQQKHRLFKSYSWTKHALTQAGLIQACKRGGPHRLRRPRKPMRGMMLHQDGSRHLWFGGEYCDLIVTLDDATSDITSAFFCEEEGTKSSFRGIRETIAQHGLFCSLYTDRGSHYFFTPEAGGKVDKDRPTQVGRALAQMGITHIPAYSPEARGRSERMFGTLQNRLVKELALMGITTMDEANRYLREEYLPRHNQRFTVNPESEQSAFMPTVGLNIIDILCIQEERIVQKDNTIHYQGLRLQIPPSPHRHHFVKATVRLNHYPDDSIALFYGPREIGRYKPDGTLQQEEKKIAA